MRLNANQITNSASKTSSSPRLRVHAPIKKAMNRYGFMRSQMAR